jgi:pSer/pThr/pTyr-binding forkhead associated (FHA) protein
MQDNNTKHGTTVNGQKITGYQISLDNSDVHTFFLGKHEHAFRYNALLRNEPVKVTYARVD